MLDTVSQIVPDKFNNHIPLLPHTAFLQTWIGTGSLKDQHFLKESRTSSGEE